MNGKLLKMERQSIWHGEIAIRFIPEFGISHSKKILVLMQI